MLTESRLHSPGSWYAVQFEGSNFLTRNGGRMMRNIRFITTISGRLRKSLEPMKYDIPTLPILEFKYQKKSEEEMKDL